MSSIGMAEETVSHDELSLVSQDGGGGYICDCEGDIILHVSTAQLAEAGKCFPLIVQMYRKGQADGQRSGKFSAEFAMRKALGL